MPESVPLCPECGATAPTTKPTKRTILLLELKTFALLVGAPLAVMVVMALIGSVI